MPELLKPPAVIQLLYELQHQSEAQRRAGAAAGLGRSLAALRRWQSDRLAHTYRDLLADPEFGPASRFFLSDIYAPRDFSQRDEDFERLHALLSRFLPAASLQLLSDALEMNRLANALDHRLLEVLSKDLGAGDAITPQAYAEAYRRCDNYQVRYYQLDLIAAIIREVGEGARLPLVGISLRLAGPPAKRAGWYELYDFLLRGYRAFRPMKDFSSFASTIRARELMILDRIYSAHPDPFDFQKNTTGKN